MNLDGIRNNERCNASYRNRITFVEIDLFPTDKIMTKYKLLLMQFIIVVAIAAISNVVIRTDFVTNHIVSMRGIASYGQTTTGISFADTVLSRMTDRETLKRHYNIHRINNNSHETYSTPLYQMCHQSYHNDDHLQFTIDVVKSTKCFQTSNRSDQTTAQSEISANCLMEFEI
jgi:hypothetical protein